MKIYKNTTTNETYYEGQTLTIKTGNTLFSGIPSEEQLSKWGFEEYVPQTPQPKEPTEEDLARQRMGEILAELSAMDYLTSKYIDGEDMSAYGDWQEKRKALREEYRTLEAKVFPETETE